MEYQSEELHLSQYYKQVADDIDLKSALLNY